MNDTLERCATSSAAGFAATVPMTALMDSLALGFPPLPPEQITRDALQQIGLKSKLSRDTQKGLSLLAHFGFGTSAGLIYGLLPFRATSRFPITSGMVYGLGVWAASYLGWLEALDSSGAAGNQRRSRNALMIAAHLVWGASLGWLTQEMRSQHSGSSRSSHDLF